MQRNVAEELTSILWSCLPRPSPLHYLRRIKGEAAFPGFLNDLIGKSAQPESPKRASVAPQAQARKRTAVKKTSKRKTARVARDSICDSSVGDLRERKHLADQDVPAFEHEFYTLLQDCISKKDLNVGRRVHCSAVRQGLHKNAFVACHLIRMFAACSNLVEANHVFSSFSVPDSSTWSAIISAHAYLGEGMQAIYLYQQMLQANGQPSGHTYIAVLKACSIISSLHDGRLIHCDMIMDGCSLDVHTSTMLIIMYATCGSIEDAQKVYDGISKQDDVMSNVMMAMCMEYGNYYQALMIFNSVVRRGTDSTNVVALVLGVKACTNLEDRESGKLLQCLIIEGSFELNTYVCSSLMAMYMEFGNLEDACYLFAKLPKRTEVTWSSMIAACTDLNDYVLAFKYFKEMQLEGVRPNDVTYISVLSACSHAGMLDEGLSHFSSMRDEHGITPTLDHYNCMVDLLARGGYVIEAEDLLHAMPFKPDAVGCMALLSHCKTHGDVVGGQTSFRYSNELDLQDASGYLLMSEIYSDAGLLKDASKVKALRKSARAYKKPGEASIYLNQEMHTFVVGEKIHPATIDIDAKLAQVGMLLKAKDYFPFLELVQSDHQISDQPVNFLKRDIAIAV